MADASSYVRVEGGRATPAAEAVDHPSGLIFIDVERDRAGGWEGEVADQLRFVDETLLARRGPMLIRSPRIGDPAGIELIRAALEARLGAAPEIGQIVFHVGAPLPTPVWTGGEAPPDAEVLAAARAIELAAVLQAGKAHWQPSTFHYELPSGQHRSDFIRLGDGFRSPRDARALATWLYPYVDTGRALLLDSSTMLPLALALQDAAQQVDRPLGPVAVRDGYPDSLLSDEELIELTVGANGALVLLSVSSTGTTRDALGAALEHRGVRRWWIESLVDRLRPTAAVVHDGAVGVSHPWICIPDSPLGEGDGCALCRDAVRAPYVRIDPGSFANTSLPEPPVVVMPDPPIRARQIDRLLELYRDVDGMGIDCDPAARTKLRRLPRRWGVRFHPHLLLDHPELVPSLREQLANDRGDRNDGRIDLDALRGFDTIVFLADDTGVGFDALLEALPELLGGDGTPRLVVLPGRAEDVNPGQLETELASSAHMLVVTVGTVTGGTLHELLMRINRARSDTPKGSYIVSGFVLHARPPSYREWQSVRSAYGQRLVAAWMTYLPAQDHPLADEQRLWRQNLDETALSTDTRRFVAARRSWVLNNPQSEWPARRATWDPASGDPNPASVLLCDVPNSADEDLPLLQPNSLFGHRMSMVGTLVGVGAALHRARLEREHEGGPPGLRFDLTRIPAVYFEAPIVSAVLRWLRPFEAFWEYDQRPAEDALRELWHQTTFEDPGSRGLLLCELLLAAAASKLPKKTYPVIREMVRDLQASDDPYCVEALEVGQQLVVAAWGPWEDD